MGVMMRHPFLSGPEGRGLFSREDVADDHAELYEFIEARWFAEIKHRRVFLCLIVISGRVGGRHHDNRNLRVQFG